MMFRVPRLPNRVLHGWLPDLEFANNIKRMNHIFGVRPPRILLPFEEPEGMDDAKFYEELTKLYYAMLQYNTGPLDLKTRTTFLALILIGIDVVVFVVAAVLRLQGV